MADVEIQLDRCVLATGKPGSGKTMLARYLCSQSRDKVIVVDYFGIFDMKTFEVADSPEDAASALSSDDIAVSFKAKSDIVAFVGKIVELSAKKISGRVRSILWDEIGLQIRYSGSDRADWVALMRHYRYRPPGSPKGIKAPYSVIATTQRLVDAPPEVCQFNETLLGLTDEVRDVAKARSEWGIEPARRPYSFVSTRVSRERGESVTLLAPESITRNKRLPAYHGA